jgi:hypothetical protein
MLQTTMAAADFAHADRITTFFYLRSGRAIILFN